MTTQSAPIATHNLAQIKHDWERLLAEDVLDVDGVLEMHSNYRRAVRRAAVYERLYDEQRVAYQQERDAVRLAAVQQLDGLTKQQIADAIQVGPEYDVRKATRADLVDWFASLASTHVLNEHARVKQAWAAMSEAQRNGDALQATPFDALLLALELAGAKLHARWATRAELVLNSLRWEVSVHGPASAQTYYAFAQRADDNIRLIDTMGTAAKVSQSMLSYNAPKGD